MAQGAQQAASGAAQTLPEALDELSKTKDQLNKALEATGVADKVSRYNTLVDLTTSMGLIAYIFDDKYNGSSTETDVHILEAFKLLKIPGITGVQDKTVDKGISGLQYVLEFTGEGKDNDVALGGLLYALALFSKSTKESRDREYGQSPSLNAWYDALGNVTKFIDDTVASFDFDSSTIPGSNFSSPAARSAVESAMASRMDEFFFGIPASASAFDLHVNSSGEIIRKSATDHDVAAAQVTNGLVTSGGGWNLNYDPNKLNLNQYQGNWVNNTFTAAATQILADGYRPGNVNTAKDVFDFSLRNASQSLTYGSTLAALLNSGDARARLTLPTDPLLLDLNGDGVRLTDYLSAPVFFDADNDGGSLEETGWVNPEDGIVVLDANANGKIDNISETLSEYFGGKAGTNGEAGQKRFANGFAALASLDSNADGVFDVRDSSWSSVKVWVDGNHDGKSWNDINGNGSLDAGEASELKSFSDLGITRINLDNQAQSGEVRDGNEVLAHGTFVQNGLTREAIAANFLANPNGHTFTSTAAGTVVSTQGSGQVAAVKGYVSSSTTGETIDVAQKGVANATGGLGNDVLQGDAQTNWLAGGQGSDTFYGGAGDDVLLVDGDDLSTNVHGGDGTDIVQVIGEKGVSLNLADASIEIAQGGRGDDAFIGGGNSTVYMRGGDGDDVLVGGSANDALSGENGDDTLFGGAGNDVLRGHRGADRIDGGSGNDLIDGGQDDDNLSGGVGDDILLGGAGDDRIDGGEGTDVLELSGDFADYRITRAADGVWISDTVTGRDGTDFLKSVEKASFKNLKLVEIPTDTSAGMENPLLVKDVLSQNKAGASFDRTRAHLIGQEQLLRNDLDWQHDTLHITGLFDVVGGTASLTQAGDVLFTPDATFTGIMGFKYTVADAKGNEASDIVDMATGESATMRAAVYLRTADLPSDPLVTDQWYLSQANILPVWKDYTGRGVKIAQIETNSPFGTTKEVLDYRHADLKDNIDEDWLANATPGQLAGEGSEGKFSEHATLVAGVMVAARNGEGSVGVAYDATVAGYWINKDDFSNMSRMREYDVVNHSWGSESHFDLRFSPATLGEMPAAYREAIGLGRDGLGTVIVTAGGNDRDKGGNTNYSNPSNTRSSIVVGAINATSDLGALQAGGKPFSNPGASILVSAPGSNVTSTSRLVQNDNGSTFGSDNGVSQGTSFAAPIVSGIVALMLEANPELGYRDVQQILALSARKVADAGTVWQDNGSQKWNGGGMHVSHDYGYGEVDARAAVRLAETWHTQQVLTNEFSLYKPLESGVLNLAITDGQQAGISHSLTLGNVAISAEHVEIKVNLTHDNPGDLILKLISPSGTESILMNRPGKAPGSAANDRGDADFSGEKTLDYVFSTALLRGEAVQGEWTLKVIDSVTGATGTLNSWSMNVWGAIDTHDDQYVYTDEYAQLGVSGTRGTLNDTNGGKDTINAAAIGQKSYINLSKGEATLAGTHLTIQNPEQIENAIGGEFADELHGNNASNMLVGGSGDDVLYGGAGRDLLLGGKGNNTLAGGADLDYFVIERANGSIQTITDFMVGTDKLVLSGFSDFGHGLINTTQQGADAVISLSGVQSIRLKNVDAAQVNAEDFLILDTAMSLAELTKYGAYGFGVNSREIRLADSVQGEDYSALSGGQRVFGGTGADIIRGGSGADVLVGDNTTGGTRGSNDFIEGGAGNDVVRGGAGNDVLRGGLGQDYVSGDAGDDVIYLEGDQGSFELGGWTSPIITWDGARLTGAAVAGGAGNDRFVVEKTSGLPIDLLGNLIEDFEFSNPNEKIDLSQINSVGSMADLAFSELTVNGQHYLRVMLGGTGASFITLKGVTSSQLSPGNFIFGSGSGGTSSVPATGGIIAGKELHMTVTNPTPLKPLIDRELTGELVAVPQPVLGGSDTVLPEFDLGIIYWANATGERVAGTLGTDTLYGGEGNDVLRGENDLSDTAVGSADRLFGGAGHDVVYGGAGDDVLWGNNGMDYLNGGAGNDTLYIEGDRGDNYTGELDFELPLITVEGVVLTGAAVAGGAGSDRFIVDDSSTDGLVGGLIEDFEVTNPSEKIDLSEFSSLRSFAELNFSDLMVNGQQYLRVWLGPVGEDNSYITLKGVTADQLSADSFIFAERAYSDPYIFRDGDGTLVGNAGGNTLAGWDGKGILEGRSGDDTYIVDDAGDIVREVSGGGYDRVESYISYVLPDEVEELVLESGTNGTGNALANRLVGNALANILDGGAGSDVMVGGKGNDTYIVDEGADRIVELSGEGIDTVKASVSFTLSPDLENLILTGTANINATGNAANNQLTGNGGNNRLDGGMGNDWLSGGAGNDLYQFDRNGGQDVIDDFDSAANTDVLQFGSGISADQLWFRKNGMDLEVSIIGTADKVTISKWSSSDQAGTQKAQHVEQFRTADGKVLLDNQVDQLVGAMAAFAPPAAGQTSLPNNYKEALDTVIASNWQ
ncbi:MULTISPECIES: S8 family serine peptidase [Pseudomonas]|uniref:S8 family serine peptidase n=1 Tax=Pseudomonas TaxID=286 RepID=UPI002852F1C9|nr:S8 family serine peptidase [Pseudomonas brassicacearum]